MKRLRDELNSTDPQLRAAAQLMRRIGPLPPDAQRQRRVRLMLGAPRRRPLFFIPRPAIALGILLASVAGASAMVGGGWKYARQGVSWLALSTPSTTRTALKPARAATAHGTNSETAKDETLALAPALAQSPAVAPVALPPVVAAQMPTPVVAEEPAPVVAISPVAMPVAARHHHRAEAKHRGIVASARPVASAKPIAVAPMVPSAENATPIASPSGPGAELLIEALEARRAGSMTRAARLLTQYRQTYPNGALQEEALALSLEAATASGDSDAAEDLAREYLRRFPGGHFREHARQVLKTLPR